MVRVEDSETCYNVTPAFNSSIIPCGLLIFSLLAFTSFRWIAAGQFYCYQRPTDLTSGDCRTAANNTDCIMPYSTDVIWTYSIILLHTTMTIKTREHSVVYYQQRCLYLRMTFFIFIQRFLRRIPLILKSDHLIHHI